MHSRAVGRKKLTAHRLLNKLKSILVKKVLRLRQ
jgi:hypothetical protein